jgi:hypothetical protein
VPVVDIIDEVFIVASPENVRAVVCDPHRWCGWLPGVMLTPYDDRGRLGVRWTVAGELTGTAEVWLEEHGDGTIVHAYVRADPADRDPHRLRRSRRRVVARYVLPLKRRLLETKDLLEGDRRPGSTRVPLSERVVSASEGRQGPRRGRQHRPTGTGSGTMSDTSSERAWPDGRPDDVDDRDRR